MLIIGLVNLVTLGLLAVIAVDDLKPAFLN
jgi:hypothetical protein